MSEESEAGSTEPGHGRLVLKVILATSLVLAIITAVSVTWGYNHLNGNLKTVDFEAQLGEDRPENVEVAGPQEPIDILVMGSDARDCEGCGIDDEGSGGSDTTILIHLSADRKRAYGISIPRDTLVNRPKCETEDGKTFPPARDAFWNAAFRLAGPTCTARQLEAISGIRIEHFVVVNMAGFQDMVDAVGGVDVCIPEDIDDREHGIFLEAGERRIDGRESLSYVRVRHVGDGSDLSRIRRQQAFLASMSAEVLAADTFTSVPKLYGFLNATTKSLTLDNKLDSLGELADLGFQFRDIGLDKIRFVTIPWREAPEDRNRVRLLQPQANTVFKRLRKDLPLTKQQTSGSITAGQLPGGTAPTNTGPTSTGPTSTGPTSTGPTGTTSASPSGVPTKKPSTGPTPSESNEPTDPPSIDAITQQANEQAGLC